MNVLNVKNIKRIKSALKSGVKLFGGGKVAPIFKRPAHRWNYNAVKCYWCARVDQTRLFVDGDGHEYRVCLFNEHIPYYDYIYPEGSVFTDTDLYVGPLMTCNHFLSRAW